MSWLNYSRKLIATIAIAFPLMSFAQYQSEIGEGFDKQSPEEIESARTKIKALFGKDIKPKTYSSIEKQKILEKYQHLDPKKEIPTDLLEATVLYFDQNKDKFPNQNYFIVINFKHRSDNFRFFVVNLTSGEVEKYRTTHARGSDKNKNGFAESFGNVINSGASSLGFIRTAEVYVGKFKRSVRLDGLASTNSNIRERAIVLHGWDNAYERPVLQGLSWGCPALDWAIKDSVIDKIKEGGLMYIGVSKN